VLEELPTLKCALVTLGRGSPSTSRVADSKVWVSVPSEGRFPFVGESSKNAAKLGKRTQRCPEKEKVGEVADKQKRNAEKISGGGPKGGTTPLKNKKIKGFADTTSLVGTVYRKKKLQLKEGVSVKGNHCVQQVEGSRLPKREQPKQSRSVGDMGFRHQNAGQGSGRGKN